MWRRGEDLGLLTSDPGNYKNIASSPASLVPRPFPPPVFDRLLYKNGGEGLGERVTFVMSGRREGRREGGGARRRISRSFL